MFLLATSESNSQLPQEMAFTNYQSTSRNHPGPIQRPGTSQVSPTSISSTDTILSYSDTILSYTKELLAYNSKRWRCELCNEYDPYRSRKTCRTCNIQLCNKCDNEHREEYISHVIEPLIMGRPNVSMSSSPDSNYSSASRSTQTTLVIAGVRYCNFHRDPHQSYCEECKKSFCDKCREFMPTSCTHRTISMDEAKEKAIVRLRTIEIIVNKLIEQVMANINRAKEVYDRNSKNYEQFVNRIIVNGQRVSTAFIEMLERAIEDRNKRSKYLKHYSKLQSKLLNAMNQSLLRIRNTLLIRGVEDALTVRDKMDDTLNNFDTHREVVYQFDESKFAYNPPDGVVPDSTSELFSRPLYNLPNHCAVKRYSYQPPIIIGGEGTAQGQLCRPWGVCVNHRGEIIVADRSNNRIQIFEKTGKFLRAFGSIGSEQGQLLRPAGITVNPRGQIVVVDKDNHRIQVFTMEGKFVRAIGKRGEANGEFNYPWDVTCNANGDMLVSDSRNHRVQLFKSDGTFIRSYGRTFQRPPTKNYDQPLPRGVAFLPQGGAIIAEFSSHCLYHFSQLFSHPPKIIGSEGSDRLSFKRPSAIVCDDYGNIIVTDNKNKRIKILNSFGHVIYEITKYGDEDIQSPGGVAITPEGRIVYVEIERHLVIVI